MRIGRSAARLVGSFGVVVAIVAVAAGVAGAPTSGAAPGAAIERASSATASATRRGSVQLAPVPPPPYPTGVCDGIAVGLSGTPGRPPAQVRRLGTSVQGRPIWAEYWGNPNPSSVSVVVAQVHGNECSPTLLAAEVRRHPPTRNGVWLIPTLNPDGYAANARRNANEVDLNADGGNVSQPETQALMSFIDDTRPDLVVHVHSPNGFAGAFSPDGPGRAGAICAAIEVRTAIDCHLGGAGARSDVRRWFLWQGHARFGGESLLVELHAVSDFEVPVASPRPATRSVEQVRADAEVIVRLLDQ